MDSDEDLQPIDVLTHKTQELQQRFRSKPNQADQIFDEFLSNWETSVKYKPVKNINVEFPKDLDWFNVTKPLSMAELRGKIVILDFFTYCCINCMHLLPDLHALEKLFPPEQGLVVIGVHSPKFANERDASNILSAAQRYNIEHAIVNDPHSQLWRAVGIHCWPSLLILSPLGQPMLLLVGEGHGNFLERFIEKALRHFQHKNEIKTFALPLKPSKDLLPASSLRFPAKIARNNKGDFAVADAGNNRILVFNIKGVVLHKIGGNGAGFVDGDLATARFNSPQGVDFLNDETLLVADTENHVVRQINLGENKVATLAGTGQQGNDRVGGKLGPLQAISSPWDVAVYRANERTIVLISMAGTHQIWAYFAETTIWWKSLQYEALTCAAIAGNGREENRNNSYPQNAAFAQPSGIAIGGEALFIADSESSSIRKVCLTDGKVLPVVGGDRNPSNLFAFGDLDGKQYSAKLQHPLAVAFNHGNGSLYVADTYNHKIKVINVTDNQVTTLAIKGENGKKWLFNEPAGLCCDASGENLLVADTNNHDIKLVDLKTLTAHRFALDFSQLNGVAETDAVSSWVNKELLRLVDLKACHILKLQLKIELNKPLKFTESAPQKWALQVSNSSLLPASLTGRIDFAGVATIQLQRPKLNNVPTNDNQPEKVHLDFTLSLCDDKCCLMRRFRVTLMDKELNEQPSDNLIENLNILVLPKDIQLR